MTFGYAADPISVVPDALEGTAPLEIMEEAGRVPGVELGREAGSMVMDSLTRLLEVEQAQLATDPAPYSTAHKVTLSGNDRWSDPDSDPQAQIRAYREVIRRSIGRYPNVLHLAPGGFTARKVHPKVKAQFVHTTNQVITEALLAQLFEIDKVVVGTSVYADDGAADAFQDVWPNAAVLAFVAQGSNWRVPSDGYTYQLPGMPLVERPYEDRNAKSGIYPTTSERRPDLGGAEAGFLIQDPACSRWGDDAMPSATPTI